ncbi:glycosyltransferase [Luteimonas sp. XNQY3]|nr:glycosyltransferase [Luteimonas sp. XNQY3]MCD9005783.1 glycosyltransferase [Luteimonas sp. XNQY3]
MRKNDPLPRIAVIIPSFRVRRHILDVIAGLPPWIFRIVVIDDRCPEHSGDHVRTHCRDPRVLVLENEVNLGVGGATMRGYAAAIAAGADILVKMDGDGQMDPDQLGPLVAPIISKDADYSKGNRFYDLAHIGRMPGIRILGNAALSMMSKLSSGYWDVFDPTNGYTALHAAVARQLPFDRVSTRYFFETDMLFRLNTIRARVVDVPMPARYGDEVSNLRIGGVIIDFLLRHLRNAGKRIFYNYFLRDASLASIQLVAGVVLTLAGGAAGIGFWFHSFRSGIPSTAGEVMLAALPIVVGSQLMLGFLAYDIASTPRRALHPLLERNMPELGD